MSHKKTQLKKKKKREQEVRTKILAKRTRLRQESSVKKSLEEMRLQNDRIEPIRNHRTTEVVSDASEQ